MIHADTADAAAVILRTVQAASDADALPVALPEILPLLTTGLLIAQREMAMYCIDQELS